MKKTDQKQEKLKMLGKYDSERKYATLSGEIVITMLGGQCVLVSSTMGNSEPFTYKTLFASCSGVTVGGFLNLVHFEQR